MWFQRPSSREQEHRAVVLRNLHRLETFCTARGVPLDIDQKATTQKLEDLLWTLIAGFEKRGGLDPAPGTPAEARIRDIWRAAPPIPPRQPAERRFDHDIFRHLQFR